VTQCIDEKEAVDAIYLNFAKAFEKVPHKRLIHRNEISYQLESLGITGRVMEWINEWLRDRKQKVCINGSASGWRNVTSGVPQGSWFDPVLFLIYINDLDSSILSWVLKFADDTKLFGKAYWQMGFNVDKYKIVHLGTVNMTTIFKAKCWSE